MNLFDSFQSKKFKHGGYAALLVAVVLAVLVAVNLLVDLVPFRADLTKEKIYSLSEQTYNVLDNLEQEVDIYLLAEAGNETPTTETILQRYAARTDKLRLDSVDPLRNPGFAKQFEEEGNRPVVGSVIVTSGDRSRVISPYDMVNYRQADPNNPFSQQASSLKAEQVLTGAILYVTGAKQPVVYTLKGHRENGLPFDIRQAMENENYVINDLTLLTQDRVPDDADILAVISPKVDITEDEEEKIRDFLFRRSGSAFFMMDIQNEEFPNLADLIAGYGLDIERMIIFERDANHHVPKLPFALVPRMEDHTVTSGLESEDLLVLFPFSQAVREREIKRRSIEIEPLLTSTEKSYGKIDINTDNQEQTPQDPDGPFNLAVAVTDEGEDRESRAVVTASSFFLNPEAVLNLRLTQPGNIDFYMNCLSWLQDQEELISIRPKNLLAMSLRLTQVQFYLFAGITVVLIPLTILGAGLIVWLRRRHL